MSTSPSIPLVPTKSDEELLESASPVKVLTTPDSSPSRPKILVVTPEITYLPHRIVENQYAISQYSALGDQAVNYSSKAGGLADVSASLVSALYDMGADVHIALPFYRRIYHIDPDKLDHYEKRRAKLTSQMPEERVHFAKDYIFNYRERVYSADPNRSVHISLAFQREVINHTIPELQPDLVHCNDWMTGLIPAFARRMHIPSLFTVHNIHTQKTTMEEMENAGIDAAFFWQNLYFERAPWSYEESRSTNQVDLLTSGIFSAHFINTVSPTFLQEIVDGWHGFIPDYIRGEIENKYRAGVAAGILNAPDPEDLPETDPALVANYSPKDFVEGKKRNKVAFQQRVGLRVDPEAPLFLWPSRLDPIQKGPQLLSDILYNIIHNYWERGLQVAFVADGPFQHVFRSIADQHQFQHLIAVLDFDKDLSKLGYAASDFILMPSRYEPCGLPQMVAPIYGSLPVAHDTGGIHDTIQDLDVESHVGNGFLFKYFDDIGLNWAIDQAMAFYSLPSKVREAEIRRVMKESRQRFNHHQTAQAYIALYEKMLDRKLVEWGDGMETEG
jgi:ADP-glucose type glycogen/starch synthase